MDPVDPVMCTPPPASTKPHVVESTRPLENANQTTLQPSDEVITTHSPKRTFFGVAKYIMSHSLKRSAGHPAPSPFRHLRRRRSQNIEINPTTQHPAPEHKVSKPSSTPCNEDSGVTLQLSSTDTGWVPTALNHQSRELEPPAGLIIGSSRGSSGSDYLPAAEKMNAQSSYYCPTEEFVSSNASAWNPPHNPMYTNLDGFQVHAAYSEPRVVDGSAISRHMSAFQVVSQLVKHDIKDLSNSLDRSTFEGHPLVTGGSSDIYRGQLTSGTEVAVKILRSSTQYFSEISENIQDAAREIHTWSKCNHPNVLPLYGLVTLHSRIGMVSPWMSKGTMPRYLKMNPEANRHNLCIQICEGLSYLHKNEIIHGDLKGANVLISKDGAPVLTDFGNSTLRDQTLKFTQAAGEDAFTVRWSAPEFIKDNGVSLRTKASDIYALGMTIYEAVIGHVPYYGQTEVRVIIMVAVNKVPPERPRWMPKGNESGDRLWSLLLHCWAWEPEKRPSALQVKETIQEIEIERLRTDPPTPFLQL
ncbi:Non-receptor tyrosine-protein kinase TYK2 [Homo sapiens] [Rhizoctonia solani]|uniref:Non-receptor tyrosine-protein kinase TYK2 [Homo sapiens] n=1 Tax=Rhizoctonia solani TaxID=456999 RepID=A0A0K6G8R3_9AGAM|nr:Non-receptor tyrosine-protein kinase TYK2 [Homo sapiens] [Rhizoctonia solani]